MRLIIGNCALICCSIEPTADAEFIDLLPEFFGSHNFPPRIRGRMQFPRAYPSIQLASGWKSKPRWPLASAMGSAACRETSSDAFSFVRDCIPEPRRGRISARYAADISVSRRPRSVSKGLGHLRRSVKVGRPVAQRRRSSAGARRGVPELSGADIARRPFLL